MKGKTKKILISLASITSVVAIAPIAIATSIVAKNNNQNKLVDNEIINGVGQESNNNTNNDNNISSGNVNKPSRPPMNNNNNNNNQTNGGNVGNNDVNNTAKSEFNDLKVYSTKSGTYAQLKGKSLSNNVSDYVFNQVDSRSRTNNNWEIKKVISDNEIIFGNNNTNIEKLTIVESNNSSTKLDANSENRQPVEVKKSVFSPKDLGLDETKTTTENAKLLDINWILNNKDAILKGNTSLINQNAFNPSSASFKVNGDNISVSVQLEAYRSYDEFGVLLPSATDIKFEIQGFNVISPFAVKEKISKSDLGFGNDKFAYYAKQNINSQWVFDNKDKLFDGTKLITSKDDISVSNFRNEQVHKLSSEQYLVFDVTVKANKWADKNGFVQDKDTTVPVKISSFEETAPIAIASYKDKYHDEGVISIQDIQKGNDKAIQPSDLKNAEFILKNINKFIASGTLDLITKDKITNIEVVENHSLDEADGMFVTMFKFTISKGSSFDKNGNLLDSDTNVAFKIVNENERK